ncbi:hypothetical protein [Streptomyces sp. NRRL S-350]|uniref:hypothetical protein n=1 Tax=Streptomyces sp. NRRL S-350 TaxID=1463902 RepID=UPI0004C2842F|nr:hypothetical protein [Streptomyces sp. NRRL S-350]
MTTITTTTADGIDLAVKLTKYGPNRPGPAPIETDALYGREGYLFTVPADFPADVPPAEDATDWQVTVYRSFGGWEVRDVDGFKKVWATGHTRRSAVRSAVAEIARIRRRNAANRVQQAAAAAPAPAQAEADDITGSYEWAFEDAQRAREAMMKAGLAMIGMAVREQYPDATDITVRTKGLALAAVHQGTETVWTEPQDGAFDKLAFDANGYLTDTLTFVRTDEEILGDFGWEEEGRGTGVFTVALPGTPRAATTRPIAGALELLGAVGVLSAVRAAVELLGSYGDPYDQLSSAQVGQVTKLAGLFADYDGDLDGPLRLVGGLGVRGALRTAVELYDTVGDPDGALTAEQVDQLGQLDAMFAAEENGDEAAAA